MIELPWVWLVVFIGLAWAGWWCGHRAGSAGRSRAVGVMLLALAGVLVWSWLCRHPATAVRLIPAGWLGQIESVAAMPMLALLLGAGWSQASGRRAQGVVVAAAVVAAVHFAVGSRCR